MKTKVWIAASLAAVVLMFAGCGKSNQPPPAPAPRPVAVNVPKLRDACASGDAAVQAAAGRAVMAIRMGDYATAAAELDALAANTSLTETQKQAVSEVREQVKQNLSQASPSSADQ